MAYDALKFIHILSIIFMSAPLYNLIVVNERVLFGKAPFAVDRYFENIIKGAASRCYIYQLTAFASGISLVLISGMPLSAIFTNGILLAKVILLLVLSTLLSFIHFKIQPGIEKELARVSGDSIPPETLKKIGPLRILRKRLAALCLFIFIVIVLLGLQTIAQYGLTLNIIIIALAAIFSYRVYRTPIRLGWV
ncbi:MAG: hypothetical protein KAR06_01920 [Deltaproteobacteria bacterium]|nr:hypothetical protein [Deltaproteobacteria bacterium]